MGLENLSIENTSEVSFTSSINEQIKDYRVFLYRFLFIMICLTTIKLFLLFKSPKSYKKLIDRIFNIQIKISGCVFTVYIAIIVWILFLILLFVEMQFQKSYFDGYKHVNSQEIKMERLKNKWILESELWMISILIIEWM